MSSAFAPILTNLYDIVYICIKTIKRWDTMEDQDGKNYLTAKEAAAFLGIKPQRLRQLRLQGRVEGTRLGYNETVYTIAQLRRADISKKKPGKKVECDKTHSKKT